MNLNKRSDAEARTDARVINPLPIIDGLTENMEVDVDALQGKNLKVFIRGADVEHLHHAFGVAAHCSARQPRARTG